MFHFPTDAAHSFFRNYTPYRLVPGYSPSCGTHTSRALLRAHFWLTCLSTGSCPSYAPVKVNKYIHEVTVCCEKIKKLVLCVKCRLASVRQSFTGCKSGNASMNYENWCTPLVGKCLWFPRLSWRRQSEKPALKTDYSCRFALLLFVTKAMLKTLAATDGGLFFEETRNANRKCVSSLIVAPNLKRINKFWQTLAFALLLIKKDKEKTASIFVGRFERDILLFNLELEKAWTQSAR